MRALLACALVLSLSACSIVYRLPIRQGNVLEQKDLNKLQVGMTRAQVEYLLGAPLSASPFDHDRWDYVSYYRAPHGKVTERTISLFFKNDELNRMQGVKVASATPPGMAHPDKETILRQEEDDKNQRSRVDSEKAGRGGVIAPPSHQGP
jgi:Small protein A (tmRNA-binding)